ncbi:MAG TPA: hypothetical protein VM011_13150 [Gammaproteobacteria bacterium]|nr:hypothetical protein [Gammaproteobacteria bacterium]
MDDRHSAGDGAAGERLTPLEAYDLALRRAHAARAQLLHNVLYNCAQKLRERICSGAERLRINLCPLCSQ